jgi:hypothetical protein
MGNGQAWPLDHRWTYEIRSADERALTGGPVVSATEEGGRLTSQAQHQGGACADQQGLGAERGWGCKSERSGVRAPRGGVNRWSCKNQQLIATNFGYKDVSAIEPSGYRASSCESQ